MAVDYDAWLENPDNANRRCLLVDLMPYSNGSVATRKISTLYAPNAGAYLPEIIRIPAFEARIRNILTGFLYTGVGEIEVSNNGQFDSWIDDNWRGREIELRFGDFEWERADFRIIRKGKIKELDFEDNTRIKILFNDRMADFDKLIQLDTVDDGDNGEVEIPLAYGDVKHGTPVLVDEATREYRGHGASVEDIVAQLYVDGLASAITVTPDNSDGTFTLASAANGRVTIDILGDNDGSGSALKKPGEIIRRIATDKVGFADPAEIDTTAFGSIDTGAPDVGIFVDRSIKARRVITEVAASNRLWTGINREGKLTIGRYTAPTSGASVLDLRRSKDEIIGPINVRAIDRPVRYKTRLGYAPCWGRVTLDKDAKIGKSQQAMYVDGTTVENLREYYERGYKIAEYEDANKTTIQTEHADAEVGEVEETIIANKADGETEAAARQGFWNQPRFECEFEAWATPFKLDIGQVITPYDDHPEVKARYHFESGRPIYISKLIEHPDEGRVEIVGLF